jgi:hypothetical protein
MAFRDCRVPFAALALLTAPLPATAAGAADAAPKVTAAAFRAPAVPGRPGVLYLSIAGGPKPDRLLAVEVKGARAELHETRETAGIMRMAAVKAIAIPAGGKLEMRPGGLHVMLFGLTPPSDGKLPVALVFEKTGRVAATATPMAAAAAGHVH